MLLYLYVNYITDTGTIRSEYVRLFYWLFLANVIMSLEILVYILRLFPQLETLTPPTPTPHSLIKGINQRDLIKILALPLLMCDLGHVLTL